MEVTKEELKLLSHEYQVRFALFSAKQIQHLIKLPEAFACIETVEKYLADKATQEDCKEVANHAYNMKRSSSVDYSIADIAYAANNAYYANYVVNAAYNIANVASNYIKEDKEKIIKEQREYYLDLLNINLMIERELI